MAELAILAGVVALLIAVNGLFVAAEFAIVGTSRAAARTRAEGGGWRATRLAAVVVDPLRQDRFIATAQLGITVASLGLGMYGEHALAGLLMRRFEGTALASWGGAHAAASVVAIVVLTYLHVVVGEMVPKSLALQNAAGTAHRILLPVLIFQWALAPAVFLLNGMGNGLLRLFGVDRRRGEGRHYTPEELEIIVARSQRLGHLPETRGRLVRELFDFFELTAEQVMVPRVHVVGIPLGADRAAVRAILEEATHSRYPVYHEDLDHITGFVHIRDLARALARRDEGGGAVTAEQVRPAPQIPASLPLDDALAAMAEAGAQLAVVLDEHGGTAGVLLVEDVFEEVVGELEEDVEATGEIRRLAEETLLVAGTARLEEVSEALGVALDHPEVDTISGLVLDRLGRPARSGDRVEYRGLELVVATVEGKGVDQCRVRRTPAAEPLDAASDPEPDG